MTDADSKEVQEADTERDPRWAMIVSRAEDAEFFYAVATTGVYCRPSCPSRRARPEHVRFHETRDAAERAGFRPCKRCRPDQPSRRERDATLITGACRLIESSDVPPSLAELAAHAGVSAHHFHRLFKSRTGLTPKAYAMAQRARRVRDELERSGSVTQAIVDAGYNSNSRFYEASDQILGMTPKTYRQGGAHVDIHFAIAESSLGAVLVARSPRGICAILLGDDPEALIRDLQDRFPKANLIGGDSGFEDLVARVLAFIDAPALGLDLPLDIRGTAFQQRVWQALREIPVGTTASYTEVAERIGAPKSVRAVAQACAANALALAIPCHRVVRNDGGLSGYRWGVARKRELLDRESQARDGSETP